jgi:ATP-dependent Lhr-like helicase
VIARQWLDRYGNRRARDVASRAAAGAVGAIYHELKRLEFRGDVRRGYFVRGLSGAHVQLCRRRSRAVRVGAVGDQPIVMTATDPANGTRCPRDGNRG